jgi:protein dithiol oxidoreductase (disulfide-forming)
MRPSGVQPREERKEMIGRHLLPLLIVVFLAACHHNTSPSPGGGGVNSVSQPLSIKGSYGRVWIEGKHYAVIRRPQATRTEAQDIEVIEFFQYGCGHCYVLEPWLVAWEESKPADVKFTRVPVTYKPAYIPHARLFYTLQILGRIDHGTEDLHHEVFDTIQRLGDSLLVLGNAEESEALQLRFAERFGIDREVFRKTYSSEAVDSAIHRAQEAAEAYRIQGTPTLVIGGRYITEVALAGGPDELIILIGDLAEYAKSGRVRSGETASQR